MTSQQFWIVAEGPDGVGKTTLVRNIGAKLVSHNFVPRPLRNPAGTAVGALIRQALVGHPELSPDAALHLAAAGHWQLISEQVEPALRAGQIPIMDRYILSTFVYQCILPRLHLPSFCRRWEEIAGALPNPPVTVVLLADEQELNRRLSGRNNPVSSGAKKKAPSKKQSKPVDRYEDVDAHRALIAYGYSMAGLLVKGGPRERIIMDTTGLSESEVAESVWQELVSRFPFLNAAGAGNANPKDQFLKGW